MDYEIFNDDKERRAGILALEALQQSEGWKLVEKALALSLDRVHEDLETQGFTELKQVERLQDQLAHLYKLKKLPILLVQDAQEKLEQDPPDDREVYDDPPDQSPA